MTNSCSLPRNGTRITLRRLSATDLDHFQAYRHDKEVGLYQGWSPSSDSEAISFLEAMSSATLLRPGEWCQIGIADRETGALIGDIGICVGPQADEAEIGFTLRAQSHGLGLGAEAVTQAIDFLFEHTAITRVVSITDARNLAAVRLLQRLGMQLLRTRNAFFRGEPCQEHFFSLSRHDRAWMP